MESSIRENQEFLLNVLWAIANFTCNAQENDYFVIHRQIIIESNPFILLCIINMFSTDVIQNLLHDNTEIVSESLRIISNLCLFNDIREIMDMSRGFLIFLGFMF